jgi:Protein of unknown function (DUF3761)
LLRWLLRWRERDDRSLVKRIVAPIPEIDPIEELRRIVGEPHEGSSGIRDLTCVDKLRNEAYACNNRHYVNYSGHVVRFPSCGLEDPRREAICATVSVSFSEHRRGTCSHRHGVAHWE